MNFFERLRSVCESKDSLLCVGLDPRLSGDAASTADEIAGFAERIIGETLPYAACYKPNSAFYEAAGPEGLSALRKLLQMIPEEVPVILDAKRCDIGATAEAYARAVFDVYNADATTLSPYMGRDAVDPFLSYQDRGVFMLCRTSNPGASRIQELQISGENEEALFLRVADECVSWGGQVGLVVAGNEPEVLSLVRQRHNSVWLLAPGIGAQGGDAGEAVAAGADSDGFGILPVVARGISGHKSPGLAAREYRDLINRGRTKGKRFPGWDTVSATTPVEPVPVSVAGETGDVKESLLSGLIETGCFKVGEFVLKSGKKSPFYIDLRRVISSPRLLKLAARAYAELLRDVQADRIAAIPVAALPFGAAVALESGIPLIFPRMTAKDHGTGNRIEGDFSAGERVVLLDDLITTGKSKLEAVDILESSGLKVTDLVVLLERGSQGRKDMSDAGIALHAYADVTELLAVCERKGLIDRSARESMEKYARET